MSGRGLFMLTLAVVLLGCLPATTEAVGTTPADLAVEVGVGGVARTGFWTPVTIRLPASLAAPPTRLVAVEAEDPNGEWVRSPAVRPQSAGDETWTARLLVKLGRRGGDLRVVVLTGDATGAGEGLPPEVMPAMVRETIALPDAVESSQELLLVVGTLDNAERAVRLAAEEDGTRAQVVVLPPADASTDIALPAAAGPAGLTFDAIDRAIVCGRAIAAGGRQQQLADLDQWVRDGGDLVLLAGMSVPEILAASPVATTWLPGQFSRLVPLRQAAALETYAKANRPLDRGAIDGLTIPVWAEEPRLNGVVEAAVGGAANDPPLVVRRSHGFGRITWIGLDLDARTFQSWPGTDSLLLQLLDTSRLDLAGGRATEIRRSGFDLAGQLRLAVDQYPGVTAVPFELIAMLGLLYVAALYPLDWWLASRLHRQRWLVWLPLPLIVLAFTSIAWQTGQRYKQGGWQAHTVGIIDLDQATRSSRAAGFAGIWAATNGQVSLGVSPVSPVEPTGVRSAVSWLAASGRSLGGPDALTPHPSLAAGPYHYDRTAASLANMPMAAASSRLFEATWTGSLAAAPLDSTLERTGQGTLRGGVVNRLSVSLEECVLVHGGWLYDVGSLAPEASFDVSSGRGPRSLSATLTRRQIVKDRSVAARWDADTRDVARILEVAGLYAAAGGSGYTGLKPGRLARLDLSRLLSLDRAILIGRGPAATRWDLRAAEQAANTSIDQTAPTTLWRIVLPVGD